MGYLTSYVLCNQLHVKIYILPSDLGNVQIDQGAQ